MWAQGTPGLESFVNGRSFTLFDLLGLQPKDADFLQDTVDRYKTVGSSKWCKIPLAAGNIVPDKS